MGSLVKFLVVMMGIGSVAGSTYFLEQIVRSDRTFQVTHSPDDDLLAANDAGEDQEGESMRRPAATPMVPGAPVIVSLEQTFANVLDAESHAHSLMLKLDLELFDESMRLLVDQRDGVLKSTIIEAARLQTYEQLNTLGGKVYFKEVLVSRMNEALQKAVVRDIHFNTFYLQ